MKTPHCKRVFYIYISKVLYTFVIETHHQTKHEETRNCHVSIKQIYFPDLRFRNYVATWWLTSRLRLGPFWLWQQELFPTLSESELRRADVAGGVNEFGSQSSGKSIICYLRSAGSPKQRRQAVVLSCGVGACHCRLGALSLNRRKVQKDQIRLKDSSLCSAFWNPFVSLARFIYYQNKSSPPPETERCSGQTHAGKPDLQLSDATCNVSDLWNGP